MFFKFTSTFLFCGLTTGLFAQTLQSEALNLAKKFQISPDKLSILTVKVGGKKETLIDINSNKKLTLASLSKVVTSYSVLQNFSLDHQFITRIKTDGRIVNSTLEGNLYLIGGGDPSFGPEGMSELILALKKKGVKKITGDIIVDDSYFDNVRYDESRGDKRADFIYDAPVGAMSYNWNSIKVTITPGKNGEKAKVDVFPPNDYVRVSGHIRTKSGRSNDVIAERRRKKNGENILLLRGSLGQGHGSLVFERNITDPDLWSGHNLIYGLKKQGISISGKILNGVAPSAGLALAEYRGKNTLGILSDLNKDSNNHVAEMLAKAIAVKNHKQGSIFEGVKIINQETKSLAMTPQGYSFVSPSGLSPQNQISSANMLKILQGIASNKQQHEVFMQSLPVAGVDGTLKKRKIASTKVEWVKAKTGFITGAIALGGYAKKNDGTLVAFSFIYNGSDKEQRVTDFYDHLIAEIMDKDNSISIH